MKAEILSQLSLIKPCATIVADEERLRPFEADAFILHRVLPLLAAVPDREEQMAQILRICREHGTTVVTRGWARASRMAQSRIGTAFFWR